MDRSTQACTTLEADFAALVAAHDLTYSYSDDRKMRQRGEAQHAELMELAKKLGQERATALWNAGVAKKVTPAYQAQWLWPTTLPTADELIAEGEAKAAAAPWLASCYRVTREEAEKQVAAKRRFWGLE